MSSTSTRGRHRTYGDDLALGDGRCVRHESLHRREDAGRTTTAGADGVVERASVAVRVVVDDLYREGLEDAG